MSIEFFLYPSALPNAQGTFIAKTKVSHAIGINELVDRVAGSKTALGKGDIRGVIESLCEIIELEVTAGNSVQLGGICKVRAMIKGAFDSVSSGFDPAVNSIDVCVTAGSRLRKAVSDNASVDKVAHVAPSPELTTYTDVASGAKNLNINANTMGLLEGNNLSFDSEQADEGLFLQDNIAAAPVKVSVIQTATAGKIIFMVPVGEVSAESAYLLLRRRNQKNGPLVEGQSVSMNYNP